MKNKHLFVTNTIYPAELGGPSNSIHQLVKNEPHFTVFSTSKGITNNKVREYKLRFDAYNDISGARTYLCSTSKIFSLSTFCWLLKNVKDYEYLHLCSFFSPLSIMAAIACNLRGVKFSIAPRGELFSAALSYKSKKKAYALPFLRRVYNKSSFVWATSKYEFDLLSNIFENVNLIPNGYDFDDFIFEEKKSKKKWITFLGRINRIKNIELIIKAYANLPDAVKSNYPLKIVGKGDDDYLQELKILTKELSIECYVDFTGQKSGQDKLKILHESLIGILVSQSENFGNVVLEFMASGTPVITSKNLPWTHLEDEGIGFTCEHDEKSLLCCLDEIIALSDKNYGFLSTKVNSYVNKNYGNKSLQTLIKKVAS
ncbi:hypothetical protein BCS93_08875 [Vibrio breoganii]|uniref:Glycosyl transferase family 1 domain-containing protein n=1 Tax=Vibrio breoganii TaxID=553239 RepID=A0AAP8MWQ0_9VIBR|nr:glycosyltransferase [Vibrio breoganii]PMP11315.1 hypothetical protein BCS93_08875 [Vibrio breoganii]